MIIYSQYTVFKFIYPFQYFVISINFAWYCFFPTKGHYLVFSVGISMVINTDMIFGTVIEVLTVVKIHINLLKPKLV
jgi:hypothetical protein